MTARLYIVLPAEEPGGPSEDIGMIEKSPLDEHHPHFVEGRSGGYFYLDSPRIGITDLLVIEPSEVHQKEHHSR